MDDLIEAMRRRENEYNTSKEMVVTTPKIRLVVDNTQKQTAPTYHVDTVADHFEFAPVDTDNEH